MPIEECEEFTKSKDVKVYDEKKAREVTRRIKTSYTKKFNANKLFNKKLFNNLHEWLQKQINDRGIQGTIITPERMAFNQWKQERIEYYNSLIDKEPDKRDYYVNLFWEEYQKMNPKKYKADRPKDDRLNDFIEMTEEIKKQKEQLQLEAMAFEEAKEEIQEVMQDYIEELNDNGWTSEHFDAVINKTKYDTVMKALEIIEKLIAPLLDRLPKLFQDVMAVITGTKMKINEIDKTQNKKQFAQNIHK